jgi:hypothetical protein
LIAIFAVKRVPAETATVVKPKIGIATAATATAVANLVCPEHSIGNFLSARGLPAGAGAGFAINLISFNLVFINVNYFN